MKGNTGPTGMKGEKGEKGEKGDTGSQGPQGPTGLQGPTGMKGEKGEKGEKGDTGSQGPQGPTGLQGPTGMKGEQGEKGEKGDKGPTGMKGNTGPTGMKGEKGEKGEKGDTGSQGPQGPTGMKGEQGEKGEKGDKGPTGMKGEKGEKGDTGPTGMKGEKGEKGEKGDTGSQGPQGPTGLQGPTGMKGEKGEKGDTGSQGPPGTASNTGCTGPRGPTGMKGKRGKSCCECFDFSLVPDCTSYRVKANYNGDFTWENAHDSNMAGARDCIQDPPYSWDSGAVGSDYLEFSNFVFNGGDLVNVTAMIKPGVSAIIVVACSKEGTSVVDGIISNDGQSVIFGTGNVPEISNVVLIIRECVNKDCLSASQIFTKKSDGVLPVDANPDTFGGQELSNTNTDGRTNNNIYPHVSQCNDNTFISIQPEGITEPQYLIKMDTLDLDPRCVEKFIIRAYISFNSGTAEPTAPLKMYIWNVVSSNWELVLDKNFIDHHNIEPNTPTFPFDLAKAHFGVSNGPDYFDGSIVSILVTSTDSDVELAMGCFELCLSSCKPGSTGPTGPQGPPGTASNTGCTGPQGPTGNTGPQGPPGTASNTGCTGPQGPQGSTGPTGMKGEQGEKGDTGSQGPQGPTGMKGEKGEKGEKGDTGSQGPAGIGTSQIIYWNSGNNLTANQYLRYGDQVSSPQRSKSEIVITKTSTISNMHVSLVNSLGFPRPPGTGDSRTFTLYKNGVAQSLTVTLSGSMSTGNNVVDSVNVTAFDRISLRNTKSGAPTTAIGLVSVEIV